MTLNARLICIFFVIMLLAVVQMIVFRSFAGLEGFKSINPTANWSFGSIGYPSYMCRKNFIDWEKEKINLSFRCEGHTEITEVLSSGVVSYENVDDYPGLVNVFGKCYYGEPGDEKYMPYSKYVDTDSLNKDLLD